MGSAFKHYKSSVLESLFIEVSGWACVIMIFAGIWVRNYRWRLIVSAIFLFILLMLEIMVMDKKDKALAKSKKGGKHGN